MKEKIYEFTIEHLLTAARRKALDRYLAKIAPQSKWAASHAWDEEDEDLLHITTYPVKWEIVFKGRHVTVYGSGPFWAKMLFSDKKRALLREGILHVLRETGFMKEPVKAKAAKAGSRKG
jgi:hypothetical protein